MVWNSAAERRKLLRFLIVGGVNTAVTYVLYLLLLYLGLPYIVALAVDYAIGIGLGYVLNCHWTFQASQRHLCGVLKYCANYAGIFVINLALLILFVETFDMVEALAQIPALALATVVSYAAQRFWVFKSA
ncbi:MAG TPA: GtrA family protein [Gammaproteobacteria bacterium]|nr:GtrA family protein [Gammaproteobacteria bacterium]